jgi:hypothetical protein
VKTLLGYVISIGTIIVLYGVINMLLVGGQKLWHHGDQVKLDTLKADLQVQLADITKREAELKTLGASIDESEAKIARACLQNQKQAQLSCPKYE